MKKILTIFFRDLKVNMRDFLSVYIYLFPIIFSIIINFIAPSINETTVNFVFLENTNPKMIQYFQNYSNVEKVKNKDDLENRIEKRDDAIGILSDENGYYIFAQGNEQKGTLEYAKLIKSSYEMGINLDSSNAEIVEFGKTVPPLKKTLVNIAILFTSVLGGMIIGINIVEEKADKTVSAINVTPVSRLQFVIGKSLMGIILPLFGSLIILFMTGYTQINFGQVIITVIAASFISMLVGFIQGVYNEDVMSAAAGIKVLFLPMIAAVAAKEFLSAGWQVFFYWIPFYWTYKSNDEILSYNSSWFNILLYSIIVVFISFIVYLILASRIKKGLK